MNEINNARLIRTETSRAIEFPDEFELPAGFDAPNTELVLAVQDDKVIVEARAKPSFARPKTFREMLDQMETIDVEWPDVDEGLLPLDDIKL
ncbi:MAG: hypothetical protein ABS76_18785 [Pelagibacterium sp. SCN 64-44]|nr:MAG: hypothetical protein ABS76_18785 [Pelagibacterium sp. SCN 64-44]